MGWLDDMNEGTKILGNIDFDKEGFANQFKYWMRELEFFYNKIVSKQTGDPSTSYYEISPATRPKESQVAYFNLRRGYPKETYDGHYCYILKDFGIKFLVVPTTSVKDGSKADPDFEYDIKLKDFKNELISRMQITDMRTIDIQRFNEKKLVYNVITDRNVIVNEIRRILSFNIDNIEEKA